MFKSMYVLQLIKALRSFVLGVGVLGHISRL